MSLDFKIQNPYLVKVGKTKTVIPKNIKERFLLEIEFSNGIDPFPPSGIVFVVNGEYLQSFGVDNATQKYIVMRDYFNSGDISEDIPINSDIFSTNLGYNLVSLYTNVYEIFKDTSLRYIDTILYCLNSYNRGINVFNVNSMFMPTLLGNTLRIGKGSFFITLSGFVKLLLVNDEHLIIDNNYFIIDQNNLVNNEAFVYINNEGIIKLSYSETNDFADVYQLEGSLFYICSVRLQNNSLLLEDLRPEILKGD